ncbi:MAG: U32 family peptidase [Bacilli bacterium]|nr:U32 family peptidase [Bacilli bacterium]
MKELLSPAGNMECLYAAVHNGADAVYLGGKLFGARKFASNFDREELKEAVCYSHLYGVKVYVTVNTIIYENEIDDFLEYIDYLYEIGVDALIMQDIGMIYLIRNKYPNFEINASTQIHNHNNYGIKLLKELGINKVVLDRELSLDEIEKLDNSIEKEVFIHGALCNSYSGCCLFSSMNGGRSGNRGECVQSCRLPYKLIRNGKYVNTDNKYLLSTKELCTIDNFDKLMKSSVSSFKIEGRMKSPSYVGYVTGIYRKLIDNYYTGNKLIVNKEEKDNLKILFNRDFTSGYLFNDSVMNVSSSNHQGLEIGNVIEVTPKKIKIKLFNSLYQEDGIRFKNSNLGMIVNFIYNDKNMLVNKALPGDIIYLDNKIGLKEKDILMKTSSVYLEKEILNCDKKRISIYADVKTADDKLFVMFSDDLGNVVTESIETSKAINRATTKEEIIEKISKLGNTPFIINNLNIDIDDGIFVSMKLLNELRRSICDKLIEERTKINREYIKKEYQLDDIKSSNSCYEVSILARTEEQVEAALSLEVDRIYVDSGLYDKYKNYSNMYLRLPRVVSDYNFNSKNILATEYGAINKYNDNNINLISDYYLNVVNSYSIKFLLNHNVKKVTLSPEVDYDRLDNLMFKDKLELIVYGRLELMLTKSCPIREVINSCPCTSSDKYYLEDINGNRYPIIHDKCLTHIMHYKNIDYLNKIDYYKNIGIKSYRLELFDEDYEGTIRLIKRIK